MKESSALFYFFIKGMEELRIMFGLSFGFVWFLLFWESWESFQMNQSVKGMDSQRLYISQQKFINFYLLELSSKYRSFRSLFLINFQRDYNRYTLLDLPSFRISQLTTFPLFCMNISDNCAILLLFDKLFPYPFSFSFVFSLPYAYLILSIISLMLKYSSHSSFNAKLLNKQLSCPFPPSSFSFHLNRKVILIFSLIFLLQFLESNRFSKYETMVCFSKTQITTLIRLPSSKIQMILLIFSMVPSAILYSTYISPPSFSQIQMKKLRSCIHFAYSD